MSETVAHQDEAEDDQQVEGRPHKVDREEQIRRNKAAIDLLNSWAQGDQEDEEEQRETLDLLMRALDEDRITFREVHLDE